MHILEYMYNAFTKSNRPWLQNPRHQLGISEVAQMDKTGLETWNKEINMI